MKIFTKTYLLLQNYYITAFLRIFLGSVFLASGLFKITEPKEEFIEVLHEFKLLPEFLIQPFAFILPLVEIIGGVLTVLSIWTSAGLLIIFFLTLIFIGALTINLFRGIDVLDCGCFGMFKFLGKSSKEVLVRDFFLILINLWLLHLQAKKENWSKLFKQIQKKFSRHL